MPITGDKSKQKADRAINYISLITAGFIALAALATEYRSKVLFQSWSLLFASSCIAASCIPRSKRQRTLLRTVGATELLLTVFITQIAKTSDTGRSIRGIHLNHASIFSDDNHNDQLIQRTRFTPLLGRELIPNKFGHSTSGFRKVPANPNNFSTIVNIYGGSSAYDVFVTPEDSWPNQLQKLLQLSGFKATKVRNLGIPGGTTSEAIIYSSFNDLDSGIKPKCSIHYHGWNDLRNNFVPGLNHAYSNMHLPSMTESGKIGSYFSSIHGIINLAASKIWTTGQLHHLLKNQTPAKINNPPQTLDPKLRSIYSDNLETLASLGKRHGGKVVFVPQILNPIKLNKDGRYGWLPNVDDRSVMKLVGKLNDTAQKKSKLLNSGFAYNVLQENFVDSDFVDLGHFSKKGAKKFARLLLPSVIECLSRK